MSPSRLIQMEDQLKRLLTQLQDLDELKDDMEEDEYTTSRQVSMTVCVEVRIYLTVMMNFSVSACQETIDQLRQFEASLDKMSAGNISLVDSIGSVQLAIQAAIRSSTSPDILNMFLRKENAALRTRLAGLDSDRILGRISQDSYNSQATEIVKMLEKLGEPLNPKEQELLKKVRFNAHDEQVL